MPAAFHISNSELQMAVDGELSAAELKRVESHLASCWECRARRQEMETAIADFIHFHRASMEGRISLPDGPRALLAAQVSRLNKPKSRHGVAAFFGPRLNWLTLASALFVVLATLAIWNALSQKHAAQSVVVTVPNAAMTPGATVLFSQPNVCREPRPKNKFVPAAVQARVFAEYGIRSTRSESYEVDYLITPALGGADDIHNLWPESNNAPIWNAHVKDALEDRLREMVCNGQLDLQVAQREIATNWIEAYKKYFHTNRPLTAAAP